MTNNSTTTIQLSTSIRVVDSDSKEQDGFQSDMLKQIIEKLKKTHIKDKDQDVVLKLQDILSCVEAIELESEKKNGDDIMEILTNEGITDRIIGFTGESQTQKILEKIRDYLVTCTMKYGNTTSDDKRYGRERKPLKAVKRDIPY